jgi:signal transduction histidine kinase
MGDPGFAGWSLSQLSKNKACTAFLHHLVHDLSRKAKLDLQRLVIVKPPTCKRWQVSAANRSRMNSLGNLARKIARRVPGLDPDLVQACCTITLVPGLLAGPKNITSSGRIGLNSTKGEIPGFSQTQKGHPLALPKYAGALLGHPEWLRDFVSSMYSGGTGKWTSAFWRKVWHTVRVSIGLAGKLPGKFPQISEAQLAESCLELGLKLSKRDKQQAFRNPVTVRSGKVVQGHKQSKEQLSVALSLWVDPPVKRCKGSKSLLQLENAKLLSELNAQKKTWDLELEKVRLEVTAELAGGAGHEINNPLAILLGRVQGLIKDQSLVFKEELREDAVRKLLSVSEQAKRIHVLIRKLARIGRPGPGIPVLIRVDDQVDRCLLVWRERADKQGVSLRVEKQESPVGPQWIRFDPGHFKDVLDELLDNAFGQVSGDGWVRVSVSADAKVCCLDVSNNGPIISPEVARHLFDPFFSYRKAGRAPGLGLPLARSLMTVNGGRAILLSDGATVPVTFRLEIPLATASTGDSGPVHPNGNVDRITKAA